MQITNSTMAVNYANNAKTMYEKTLQQIASGLQLSSTDAASQSIYDSLQSQADTYTQGIKNANDAVGYLQIADGATQSLSKGANDLNVLSAQYNNAALNQSNKDEILQQANGIKESMNQAVQSASFNGKNVFGGDASFFTGSGTQSFSLSAPNIDNLDVTNQDTISSFQKQVSSLQSTIGSNINGLQSSINSNMNTMVAVTSAAGQIGGADYAQAANDLNSSYLQTNASLYAVAQGNNISSSSVARLLG